MKNKNFKNNEIQNYKNNHFSKIKLKSDQKLVKNQEEIFKSSNIEDSIKPPSNESYTKILHDNNGSFNRYNDKNIKADFLNKDQFIENKIEFNHKNLINKEG
ncbi:hypothetical protein H8356DRAFT_1349866 [Neocallimastix lanati (nom. inval.)]|nr:hypothetical protein H8356DRAFT_1349866 [Neocallimastix sp. JGI-2020a]